MLKFRRVKQLSFMIQVFQNHRVRILYKQAAVGRLLCHIAFSVHELYKRHIILPAYLGVILTKCGRNVYDTCTIRHCDITVTCYIVCLFALLRHRFTGAGKQRLIGFIFQIFTAVRFQDFIGAGSLPSIRQFSQCPIQQCLCHVIGITVCGLYLCIRFIRVNAEPQVGRQCPGCGGPCKEICIFSHSLKPHHCGTFFYSPIPLRHLVGGKGRPASGAVRYNFEPFVQKSSVPDFLQRPPFGFNIIIVIGDIRIVHIRPKAHGL